MSGADVRAMLQNSNALQAGVLDVAKQLSAVPPACLSSIQPLLVPMLTKCMSSALEEQIRELAQEQQQQQQGSSSSGSDDQQRRVERNLRGAVKLAISKVANTSAAAAAADGAGDGSCSSSSSSGPVDLVLDAFKKGSRRALSRIFSSSGGSRDLGQASSGRLQGARLQEQLRRIFEAPSSRAVLEGPDAESLAVSITAAMEHMWPSRSRSSSTAAASTSAALAAAAAAGDDGASDASGSDWSSDGDDDDDLPIAVRVPMPQTPADLAGVMPKVAAAAAYYVLEFAHLVVPGFSYCLAEDAEGFSDNNSLLLPIHRYGGRGWGVRRGVGFVPFVKD